MAVFGAPGADRRAPVTLGFDTAASSCSVALARGDVVQAHERREMRHGHAEALLPMIDRVAAAAGVAPGEIDFVAVSVGPGGFTGIRAGLAAAHGLAMSTGARLRGVTSCAAVAALVPRLLPQPVSRTDAPLLVALDSRRADLYVQLFDAAGNAIGEPETVLPAELARFVAAAVGDAALLIAGDASEAAAAVLDDRRSARIIAGSAPDALGVLAAVARHPGLADPAARAVYLRPPDVSFPKIVGGAGL